MAEVGVIEITDDKYPELLKEIKGQAPKKLFYKGNWNEDLFKNCLGVVGSRHLTSYGKRAIEKLVTEISCAGVTIVSGFMYGGDEAAHSATVRCGGKTIAVMPCGINKIFPEYQAELYNKILENNGLIISEYEGDFLPQTWSFVQRDRIVAGLCKAVFVTEAGLNSGSLLTANYAKKYGRKVFALPGPITSEVSKGSLKLIREGAEAVTEANDILSFYPVRNSSHSVISNGVYAPQTGTLEQKIMGFLGREPMEADAMARELGISVSQIGTTLTIMQLRGIINQENGKYYTN